MPTTKKQQKYLYANNMGNVAKKLAKKHKKKMTSKEYKPEGLLGSQGY